MPVEPKAKVKRRATRRDPDEYKFDGSSHARELELKRSRGEISCAECRNSRLNATSRYHVSPVREEAAPPYVQMISLVYSSIACFIHFLARSLATGQGTRFVLAATEHLHRRISKLTERIRLLEDALASLHSKHSDEPHPLLRHDLLGSNDDKDGDMAMTEDVAAPSHTRDLVDSFGTLSISDHGISRFFGPLALNESLLISSLSSSHTSPASSHSLSPKQRDSQSPTSHSTPSTYDQLSLFSQSFPFTPMGRTDDVQEMIESHLPPYERAVHLCETYFDQVYWLFRGVTKEQLMDEMLVVVYRRPSASELEDEYGPHDLALLFIIFAIGVLVEPELPGHTSPKASSEAYAEHFHQISRAAITLQPVLEKPSIVTIQVLHLMSIYNGMSGSDVNSDTSMEMTWNLLTLAAHLSQTIGLHRDSERWGLPPKMVQRRRILFWDLFVADVWTSLNNGRPPSFSLAYVDCNLPQYDDLKAKDSDVAFEVWTFRFASECVAEVIARTLTAEAPSYATIMELDRKVREFPLPENTRDKNDEAASFRRCVLEHIRETILVYIHRSFFAQAIIEQPANPLKSVYAPSFLAAYRASAAILKSICEQFNTCPSSCGRYWVMWTYAFSAAVVFGTVVTRGPRSPLANSAMMELDQAILLFSRAAVYSRRVTKALPILTRLSDKAHHALAAAQSDPSPSSGDGALWSITTEDTEDELDIIAGRTRFVSVKKQGCASSDIGSTVQHDHSSFDTQPRERIISFETPPPVSHRLSHRMSWTAGDSHGSLRDEYNQSGAAMPPHPNASVQYNYSYDRSRPEGAAAEYAWPAPGPSRQPYHGIPGSRMEHPYHSSYPPPLHGSFANEYPGVPTTVGQQPGMHHTELANLGLAARDSRLDERWSSFMHESGLLDDVGINYRS